MISEIQYEASFDRAQLPCTASCATAHRPRITFAMKNDSAIPIGIAKR